MYITFGHFSAQGIRPTMEDRVLFEEHLTCGTHTYSLCAIMDGHGGEFAAQFVQQHLKEALTNEMNTN
jgi:serine/threonine protein phosphatase PrpC